jgi:hypothetical protein
MSSERPISLDAAMMTSLTAVAAVAVALSLGALGTYGWSAAMGVATGGLLATANLWMIGLVSRGVLAGGPRGRFWGVAGGLKFLALMGLALMLMKTGLASGLTLAAGYASLPLGVTIGSLMSRVREPAN